MARWNGAGITEEQTTITRRPLIVRFRPSEDGRMPHHSCNANAFFALPLLPSLYTVHEHAFCANTRCYTEKGGEETHISGFWAVTREGKGRGKGKEKRTWITAPLDMCCAVCLTHLFLGCGSGEEGNECLHATTDSIRVGFRTGRAKKGFCKQGPKGKDTH